MTALMKVLAGIACCLLGLGYLMKPSVIWRINEVIRKTILNDTYMALERKKWGALFLLLGLFLLYAGLKSAEILCK
jgi:hypothetical protein